LIEPLVVGWGWGENRTLSFGSDFLDFTQWLGTNDLSAYLSVPAAIKFQEAHHWTAVRQQCHDLLTQAMHRICELTGLPPIYPDETGFYHQMATIPLPQLTDIDALKKELYQAYKIEVPVLMWNGRHFIRVSVQGYNTQSDLDSLVEALTEILPTFTKWIV
jgi:isopenicillin-N epimerase